MSTWIRYGFHAMLTTAPSDGVQILSADHRTLSNPPTRDDLNLDEDLQLPRAVVDFFQPRDGLVIFLSSEIPPDCGLGLRRRPLTLDRRGVQLMQARPWHCLSSDTVRSEMTPRPQAEASGIL